MINTSEQMVRETQGEELLNKEMAAAFLGVQSVILWVWGRMGLVHPVRKKGQTMFRSSELMAMGQSVKVL